MTRRGPRLLRAVAALVVAVLIGAVMTATPAAAAPAPAHVASGHRQLWVWHTLAAADLVALALRNDVDELLVWVGPGFSHRPADVTRLQRLGAAARAEGVDVTALGGDPSWALHPQVARAWAQEVATSGLFPALHVDIEPQALPQWTTQRSRAARGLLSALDAVRSAGLPVAADIAAWFQTVRVDGHRLDDGVFARVDAVTVMAYRDTAARALSFARAALTRASQFHVPATIGVELGPTSEPGTSMGGLTREQVLTALDDIAAGAAAAGWTAYAGTAIYDADHLAAL